MLLTQPLSTPTGALVCLTSKCNLKCQHCYYRTNEITSSRDLNDTEWHEFIREFMQFSPQYISFSGGEPLLRRELLMQLIDYIASVDPYVKIAIGTNGTLIDYSFVKYISSIPNKILFQISIDGSKVNHDSFRGITGAYEKAVNACTLITNESINLQLAHSLNKYNVDSIEEMIQFAIEIGADSLSIGAAHPIGNGEYNLSSLLTWDERNAQYDLLQKFKKEFENKICIKIAALSGNNVYAKMLRYYPDWLEILSNGDIRIDSFLPYVVGNILNEPIYKLWEKVNRLSRSKTVVETLKQCISNRKEMSLCSTIYL